MKYCPAEQEQQFNNKLDANFPMCGEGGVSFALQCLYNFLKFVWHVKTHLNPFTCKIILIFSCILFDDS